VLHAIELPLSLLAITTAILILGPGRFSLDWVMRIEQRLLKVK